MAEVIYKLSKIKAKIAEIPFILLYDKKQGESKMNVIKTVKKSFSLAFHLRQLK